MKNKAHYGSWSHKKAIVELTYVPGKEQIVLLAILLGFFIE